ncbi:MAG: hypothetical protein J0H49_30870 [Acidobacteria bacterium]|nr:hypothetical protein [Acidobacteriota bacterium]
MPQRYQIIAPTLVLAVQGSGKKPITIPTDSMVDVPLTLYGRKGLIEVQFNGETVLMFAEDIRERGVRVARMSA